MTEEEWDACNDPHRMLQAFRCTLPRVVCSGGYMIRTPDRKLQLFAVALCRSLQWIFKHEWHRMALDVTEEIADDEQQETEVRRALYQLHADMKHPLHPDNPDLDQAVWSAALPHEFWEATEVLMVACARALRTAWGNRKPCSRCASDAARGPPHRPAPAGYRRRSCTSPRSAPGRSATAPPSRSSPGRPSPRGPRPYPGLGHPRPPSASHRRV
jgi:hypothetical protein